jgi:hypothetical protein
MRCFLGGTSKLRKAIGSHPSLRRACNVLALPLIAGRMPISRPKSRCKRWPYPLSRFPFLHQLQTRAPLRNTSLQLHLRTYETAGRRLREWSKLITPLARSDVEETEALISPKGRHPDRSSGAVCRCAVGGPQLLMGPLTSQSAKREFSFSPPSIRFSYPSHSFFLLWKFLFPFDASFPLALPLHC